MIKLLQWNCRGFSGKFAEISKVIHDFQLICLQETWIGSSHRISFKNFCVFRNDRPQPRCGGGTMIICKNNLDPRVHTIDKNLAPGCDVTVVSVMLDKRSSERLLVVSFYKPPDVRFGRGQWRSFFEELLAVGGSSDILVAGDFNAQMEAWGSSRDNSSGVSLGNYLADSPFFFLNNGSATRVSADQCFISAPDLTITNSLNIDFRWSIGDDPMGSDHLPIVIECSGAFLR